MLVVNAFASRSVSLLKRMRVQPGSFNTSCDCKEGQKTALGKFGLEDDTAVFVVVALKVVD